MTTSSTPATGRPPVVDRATWQAARDELLVREKAHTRAGDALAAARRRLPMVEVDGSAEVTGADGPVPFREVFAGRDELVAYHSMWYDGAPPQGQCEGCTFNLWHLRDTVYLQARGHYFHPRSQRSWGCMAQLVDGLPYYGAWPTFERNLFRVLRIDRVVAVEVYREFAEVPPELQSYAWGERRCGLILYWTDIGFRLESPNVPRP